MIKDSNKAWADRPSELALMAVRWLRHKAIGTENLDILDVACGYGRDTFYLHQKLGCRVTGVDISSEAIQLARSSSANRRHQGCVKFIHHNFMDFLPLEFDILFVSNFYHLLTRQERTRFPKKVMENLKPNGLLFLSAHSKRDPQLYGEGAPIAPNPILFTTTKFTAIFYLPEPCKRISSFWKS